MMRFGSLGQLSLAALYGISKSFREIHITGCCAVVLWNWGVSAGWAQV